MKRIRIETKNILNILLLMYLLGIFVCNSGQGFDWFFSRFSFVVLIIAVFILKKKSSITGLLKIALVFWGYYFLSMLWASDYKDTFININFAVKILGLFLYLPTIIDNKKDLEKVLETIVLALIVMCMILVIKTPLDNYGKGSTLGNVIGLNRNILGMMTASGFLFSLHFTKEIMIRKEIKKETKSLLMYILFVIVFLAIALLSGSRKALLLSALGYALLEVFTANRENMGRKIKILAVFFTVLFVLIFSIPQLYSSLGVRIIKNIQMITGTLGDRPTDGSLQERNFYIDKAKILFKENPIFGYGGNNFYTYMKEIGYMKPAYAHNNFWELLSTLGIVGFVIYYGFWLSVIYKTFKMYRRTRDRLTLIIFVNLILFVFLDYWMVSYISEFNAIIIALAYLNVIIYEEVNRIKLVNGKENIANLLRYIKEPKKIVLYLLNNNFLDWLPFELYIKLKYYLYRGKRLNVDEPEPLYKKI